MSGWANAARGRGAPGTPVAPRATGSPASERVVPSWTTRHTGTGTTTPGSGIGTPTTGTPGSGSRSPASAPASRGGWGRGGVSGSGPAPGTPGTRTPGGTPGGTPGARPTSGWSSRGGAPQARRADGSSVPAWAAQNMAANELDDETTDAGDDWAAQLRKAAEDFLEEHRVQSEDPEDTVMRMLAMAQETMEIADNTNSELDRQIGALKLQQQDMAQVHDMLNRSDKDMNAIKSVWGGWKNIGNKKKDNQHQKLYNQWEEEFAEQQALQQKEANKQWRANEKESWKQNKQAINQTLKDEKKDIQAAKKESQALAKDIKKGRADLPNGEREQLAGGFLWTARTDGVGQKCAAEEGLDKLEEYTSQFVDRALAAQSAIRETQLRLDRVNEDMDRANSRIEVLNDRGKRYAK